MAVPGFLADLQGRLRSPDAVPQHKSSHRPAAVLVLLFSRADDPTLLLTERPGHLRDHPGQIALPGGKKEVEDKTLWDTAVREAREEIGLAVDLKLLGLLDPVEVRVSGYEITPFVAWSDTLPAFRPDHHEVESLIEVPVRELLNPASVDHEQWEFRGGQWHVSLFRLGGHIVWGATARILSDLADRIRGTPGTHTHPPGTVRPVDD